MSVTVEKTLVNWKLEMEAACLEDRDLAQCVMLYERKLEAMRAMLKGELTEEALDTLEAVWREETATLTMCFFIKGNTLGYKERLDKEGILLDQGYKFMMQQKRTIAGYRALTAILLVPVIAGVGSWFIS